MRTKVNVHTLSGHTSTVGTVVCQASEPQIITGSNDQVLLLIRVFLLKVYFLISWVLPIIML
jgi:hypothetical protein